MACNATERNSLPEGAAAGPRTGSATHGPPHGPGRATVTSPVHEAPFPFDTLVPSWNAATPAGARVGIELRVRRTDGAWSLWLSFGVWSSDPDIPNHSGYTDAGDPDWTVEVDTLVARDAAKACAYQYRLIPAAGHGVWPRLRRFDVVFSDHTRRGGRVPGSPSGNVVELAVPARSQMAYRGGRALCSPVSLSMVMAYWAQATGRDELNRGVPEVARGVYDHAHRGWGNWPFNTAYASRFGLEAAVGRLGSVVEAEGWLLAGVPLVASIAWDNGVDGQELMGAPIPRSGGHLLVVRGLTGSGDVVVNDPAAPDEAGVRRVYERGQFSRAWFANTGSSGGIVYLVHPPGWPAPSGEDTPGNP